mmetsp:Transcript_1823/g.2510  ORF Transcript_1823/g.2510 Transcript_1823/m.2510 type:complete len:146 (+) Transcript_1823:83-520(+)
MDSNGYVSYKSSETVVSEGVYQFLRGSIYGAIWGLITPFPAPGSPAATLEMTTGVFKPAPPFSAISSVPSNAIIFGSILGVQRLSSRGLEQLRRREDWWNDLFSFGITYRYYTYFLASTERRLILHNRVVGGAAVFAAIYGAFLA